MSFFHLHLLIMPRVFQLLLFLPGSFGVTPVPTPRPTPAPPSTINDACSVATQSARSSACAATSNLVCAVGDASSALPSSSCPTQLPVMDSLGPSLVNLDPAANVDRTSGLAMNATGNCSRFPGLSNSDQYCVVDLAEVTASAPRLGKMILGDFDVTACLAYNVGTKTFALSFYDGMTVKLGMSSATLLGVMFSANGCGSVQVTDHWSTPGTNTAVTLAAHAGVEVELKWRMNVAGMFSIQVVTTAAAYLNIDYNGDGKYVTPGGVLQSFLEPDCPTDRADWAVILKADMRMSMEYGQLKIALPKAAAQLLVISEGTGAFPTVHGMFELQDVKKLSDIFQGIPANMDTFICAGLTTAGVAKATNPFCNPPAVAEPKVGVYVTYKDQSVNVIVNAWNHKITISRQGNGYSFCLDAQCVTGCMADTDCGQGYHCCHSTGTFQCERVWEACCGTAGFIPVGHSCLTTSWTTCPSTKRLDGLMCTSAKYCKENSGTSMSCNKRSTTATAAAVSARTCTETGTIEPSTCKKDTGGSCRLNSCGASRDAICVSGKCVCADGMCNKDGKCKSFSSTIPVMTPAPTEQSPHRRRVTAPTAGPTVAPATPRRRRTTGGTPRRRRRASTPRRRRRASMWNLMANCTKDTGGSCATGSCHASRKAVCVAQRCECPVGTCAQTGRCVNQTRNSTASFAVRQSALPLCFLTFASFLVLMSHFA